MVNRSFYSDCFLILAIFDYDSIYSNFPDSVGGRNVVFPHCGQV